jgi:uncharacterized protein involved in exopolysaccharide biosynthesis
MSVVAGVADELDLGAVGRALLRKKKWVIAPTLIVALLTFLVVNLMPPRYKSEARVYIEGRENVFLRPEVDKIERERTVDQETVASQVQLVLSRDLARKVAKELKLSERTEFDPVLHGASFLRHMLSLVGLAKDPLKMSPEERVLEAYYERLTAFPVDRSRVIAIEFSSSDPELAAQAANAVAEGYLALQQNAKQDQTRMASQWLGSEIDTLRKRVAEAEAKVEGFRAQSNLFVGTNNTSLSNQQLGEFNSQLAFSRSQKAEAEAKARLVRDMLKSGQPIESSDIVNSELIRRLAEQGATLRAQLAEQSSTLLGNHPRIKELKAQIADLDTQIKREAEKLVRTFENDARIAAARVESLNASLDQLKRQAGQTGEQDVQLRALEREAKAQRDLLESYLAKYREANARDSLTLIPAEARIISRAVVSNTPAFPKKVPIVLIATVATLLLSTAFITTGELLAGNVYQAADMPMMDRTGAAELEPVMAAPVVRPPRAPAAEAAKPLTDDAAVSAQHDGPSIDELATGLGDVGRLAVFGAGRNIGATSTAIALARTLSRKGRVMLIDLALEAPNVAAISTEPNAPGLAELVGGTASFRHIITRDRVSRAHLIAAGKVGDDKAAIVASERLITAVNALVQTYDRVIIDAGAVTEADLEHLARLAPHAVLVAPGTREDVVTPIRERLIAKGFTDMTLFTGIPPRPDVTPGPSTEAA